MAGTDDKQLGEIAAHTRREDPRFVHGLVTGRPCRPREYRRTWIWLLLVLAVALLGVGLVLPHGLLIATGLVLAGTAGELLDPQRDLRGLRAPPPTP